MTLKKQNIDLQLIHDAKQGNQAAFTQLFNAHYHKVYSSVRNRVMNNVDAEDITMLTFEKVFATIQDYTLMFDFRIYLYMIAKRTTIDFLRYKSRRPINVNVTQLFNKKSEIGNPEQALITCENVKLIKKSLRSISPRLRSTIVMRGQGLLCKEIAEELNVSINTIVGQIRYARKYLSQVLT